MKEAQIKKELQIPVGTSDFREIREQGYYYMDKSGLIQDLLWPGGTKVTLITRPRRFGKTLAMSMLSEFFDIRRDSRDIFQGLVVSKDSEFCKVWQNQYPTVFLSLRGVDGLDFESAWQMFAGVMQRLYCEHSYLVESGSVKAYQKATFDRIASKRADAEELKSALITLTDMLQAHYHRPVILLIDEYDVPLAKASEHGYYGQMTDVMRGLMRVFKDNPALKFAVITGCLRIAKESIFTGTNNFVSDTVSNTRFSRYFGFSQEEVDRLLLDAGAVSHAEEIRLWYDGYHLADSDIYCPWDVMNYVRDLTLNPEAKPRGYWNHSSDNAIVRSFIDELGPSVTGSIETLLAGGEIIRRIREDLTYDYLHSSANLQILEENFWSVLYLTGYLTPASSREALPEGYLALRIPNREVKDIFQETILVWFQENSQRWNRKALFSAVWKGEAEACSRELSRLLLRTISYYDYKEDYYHAFLAGIFAGAGYEVESNREYGEGRSDVIVKDHAGDRAAVFEVKHVAARSEMQAGCEAALVQLKERRYAEQLEEDFSQVYGYGVTFYKKRCLVWSGKGKNAS